MLQSHKPINLTLKKNWLARLKMLIISDLCVQFLHLRLEPSNFLLHIHHPTQYQVYLSASTDGGHDAPSQSGEDGSYRGSRRLQLASANLHATLAYS